MAPGLRLGWLIAPTRLRADLVAARHASDIAGASLAQLVLAHLLATGADERHLRLVRTRQRLPPRPDHRVCRPLPDRLRSAIERLADALP
ncbi:MAG: hypothetical protein V9G19_01810 [Tetrasphaera sp.]